MPAQVEYWKQRFHAAQVDFNLSYGAFKNDKLIAFIIHGINHETKWAFNTGTGVIPKYRGQKLVDQIYQYGFPHLKKSNIHHCLLEVITKNNRAISVYNRIGFNIKRKMNCFSGNIAIDKNPDIVLKSMSFDKFKILAEKDDTDYSWDHKINALNRIKDKLSFYSVEINNNHVGHFSYQPGNHYIAQIYSPSSDYIHLINGMNQITDKVKINNIDINRTALINLLNEIGIENTIDQYEMIIDI